MKPALTVRSRRGPGEDLLPDAFAGFSNFYASMQHSIYGMPLPAVQVSIKSIAKAQKQR